MFLDSKHLKHFPHCLTLMTKYWRKPLDYEEFERKRPEAEVYVISDRCKGCGFCVEFCPKDVLEMSEKYNAKGYHYPYANNLKDCVVCGLCDAICPDFAIYVVDKKRERKL